MKDGAVSQRGRTETDQNKGEKQTFNDSLSLLFTSCHFSCVVIHYFCDVFISYYLKNTTENGSGELYPVIRRWIS